MNIGTLSFTGIKLPKAKNTDFTRVFTSKNKVNNKGLKRDTFEYSTAPIRSKSNIQLEKNKINYRNVVNSLTLINDNAKDSFEKQYKKDGLLAKSVDNISTLWFSNNRSSLIKKDLDKYNKQIEELSRSIDKGNFTKTFKNIFGVSYNQKNIDYFNKANETLILASTTKYMADTINQTLGEDLKIAKTNKGELKDYCTEKFVSTAPTGSIPVVKSVTPKETVFSNMENSLIKAVGGKDVLKNMLETQKIKDDALNEDKYKAYYEIANFLSQTSNMTAERCSKGKSLKDLTKDYDNAFELAFGKNNIQKRVDSYNRSQQIGVSMIKAGIKNPIKLALIGITGITNPLAVIPATAALDFGIDMLEKATNKDKKDEHITKDTLKNLATDTAIDYTNYVISAGAQAFIPNLSTGGTILNTILSTTRKTTLDVTSSMVKEYIKTGKWDNSQIAPRAFVATVFGKLSPDDQLSKNLLSMTKDGVKKSLLYDNSEKNSVKQFINKMQVELQKEYMQNPELYSSMKVLSMTNPQAFENLITELLQEHINQTDKNKK